MNPYTETIFKTIHEHRAAEMQAEAQLYGLTRKWRIKRRVRSPKAETGPVVSPRPRAA